MAPWPQILNIPVMEVYRLRKAGLIPAIRFGPKTFRFRLSEVLVAVERLKTGEAVSQ